MHAHTPLNVGSGIRAGWANHSATVVRSALTTNHCATVLRGWDNHSATVLRGIMGNHSATVLRGIQGNHSPTVVRAGR